MLGCFNSFILGRKFPVVAFISALLCPGPASAQAVRLNAVFARVPAVVVAPLTGPSLQVGVPIFSAVPTFSAAPALLAAAPSAAVPLAAAVAVTATAAAPAPVSAARTLGAVASGSAALEGPPRSADGDKAEAGRPFDLSAVRPATDADPVDGVPGANLPLSPARRSRANASSLDKKASPPSASATPPAHPAVHRFLQQVVARLQTLAQRTLALPAQFWPFSSLARFVAHGEPLVGLTPASAARAVERISAKDGVVIGRLAWELRDVWSVQGAERSYLSLIDKLGEIKAKRPERDIAVSIDAESLGLDLRGASPEQRMQVATDASLRIARAARDRGLALEMDMGSASAMPSIVSIAGRVVRRARMPMRLALAARYRSSEQALIAWSALAQETGLRLGVRLVKGSFIEGNQPDAINLREPLIARYKEIITLALERSRWLAVAVASQNEDIWEHAQKEARRLGADFKMHVIRGVNLSLQAKMRAAGKIERVYVSYGIDAAVMGLTELYTNWKQKRALAKKMSERID